MATSKLLRQKKFTQCDFRLLLGKQLIGGYTGRKYQPKIDSIFVGLDNLTQLIKIMTVPECLLVEVKSVKCTRHTLVKTNAQSMGVLSVMFIFVKCATQSGIMCDYMHKKNDTIYQHMYILFKSLNKLKACNIGQYLLIIITWFKNIHKFTND